MADLAESVVNRRLKCMEDIDNNLEEMEKFSGHRKLTTEMKNMTAVLISRIFVDDVVEYRALHEEVDEIDEEIDRYVFRMPFS
jgi:hypothetical protein